MTMCGCVLCSDQVLNEEEEFQVLAEDELGGLTLCCLHMSGDMTLPQGRARLEENREGGSARHQTNPSLRQLPRSNEYRTLESFQLSDIMYHLLLSTSCSIPY